MNTVHAEREKDHFSNCREKIDSFQESLQTRVDPSEISIKAKIPFKALCYREALFHRATEIADAALTLLTTEGKAISGYILTRACYETVALLFVLHSKIERVVDSNGVGGFDDYIMTHTFGWRIEKDDDMPKMPNILGAIDKLDKLLGGVFRREYEEISEYCHPNCAGVHSAYVSLDKENIWADVGSQFTNLGTIHVAGTLLASLELFEHHYNEISEFMPKFIDICEKELQSET